jgi:hypothetical protein
VDSRTLRVLCFHLFVVLLKVKFRIAVGILWHSGVNPFLGEALLEGLSDLRILVRRLNLVVPLDRVKDAIGSEKDDSRWVKSEIPRRLLTGIEVLVIPQRGWGDDRPWLPIYLDLFLPFGGPHQTVTFAL